jgi:F-type H+-transporting ATPase subunit b
MTLSNFSGLPNWGWLFGRSRKRCRRWVAPMVVAMILVPGFAGTALAEHGERHDTHSVSHHEGHAAPTLDDVNWIDGLFGGRSESTPPPFGALLINTAILFFLIAKLGGPKIREGLLNRRSRLAADIDAAAQMHKEAEAQLEHYQQKLTQMEASAQEIEALTRENAAIEREKTLSDARAQRDKIVREAEERVARELAARKDALVREMVVLAVRDAEKRVLGTFGDQDQTRFGQRMLDEARATNQGVGS